MKFRVCAVESQYFVYHVLRDLFDAKKSTDHAANDSCVRVCVSALLDCLLDAIMIKVRNYFSRVMVHLKPSQIVEAEDHCSLKPANFGSAIEKVFRKRSID